jgi:hypothetical protein
VLDGKLGIITKLLLFLSSMACYVVMEVEGINSKESFVWTTLQGGGVGRAPI